MIVKILMAKIQERRLYTIAMVVARTQEDLWSLQEAILFFYGTPSQLT